MLVRNVYLVDTIYKESDERNGWDISLLFLCKIRSFDSFWPSSLTVKTKFLFLQTYTLFWSKFTGNVTV